MPLRIAERAIILGGGATARAFVPPRYIVWPHLPYRATYLLIGPPKHGKSYVATMLGWAVASDRDRFLGHELDIRGPVVYVAAEGALDQEARFEALRQQSGPRAHPIHLLPLRIDLSREACVAELADYVRFAGARLVVIDTANRCGAGAEDTKDMAAFTNGLTALQAAVEATVIVIHHSPQADASRARGSTVLPAMVDGWWISSKNKSGLFRLRVGEGRGNGAASDLLACYRLRTYTLLGPSGAALVNEDGRPVTVGTVEQCDDPDDDDDAPPKHANLPPDLPGAIRRAIDAHTRTGITLRDAMFSERIPDTLYARVHRQLKKERGG